jgi:ankyrin repeat protein
MSEDTLPMDDQDHEKQRQFLRAVYEDMSKARQLLQTDPKFQHYRSIAGETAFHYLIVERDLERARTLLEWGSDINTQDHFGATPLSHAVKLGYPELVKWLVQQGAILELKNVIDETPLALASSNESAAIFQFLISLPRKHPIDYYYDYLTAQKIYRDKDLVMRSYLIGLGLSERQV